MGLGNEMGNDLGNDLSTDVPAADPTPTGGHPTIKGPTRCIAQSVTMFKAGDTLPDLVAILQDADGNAIDLTGAAVKFRMGSPLATNPKVFADATLATDPTTGVVTYSWASGDLDTAQEWRGEFHVTFGDGKCITFPSTTYLPISVLPLA